MNEQSEMRPFDLLTVPLSGTNLVEASAGTGKTYSIAGLFVRLLLEQGIPLEKILVMTFTEAATAELRTRIRDRIRDTYDAFRNAADTRHQKIEEEDQLIRHLLQEHDRKQALVLLENALRNFDEAAIFTIHGFCQRVLKEHAFESGSLFDAELITDQSPLIEEITDDFWRHHFYHAPEAVIAYLFARKIDRQTFMDLVSDMLKKPRVTIIPSGTEAASKMRPPADHLYKLFHQMQDTWGNERDQIITLLENTPGMSQITFKKERIAGFAMDLDYYLSQVNPFQMPTTIEKFDASYISAKGMKKEFRDQAPEHTFFSLCHQYREEAARFEEAFNAYYLCLRREYLDYIESEMQARKKRRNIWFFEDLLLSLSDALQGQAKESLVETISGRYQAAMVDEFQDTDPLQYHIFDTIFARSNRILFYIGDPKQAIYSFRGADIFAYLQASRNTQNRYYLSVNWRSDAELLRGVNVLFERERPFLFDTIDFIPAIGASNQKGSFCIEHDASPPFKIWLLEANSEQYSQKDARAVINQQVAEEILYLLQKAHAQQAYFLTGEDGSGRRILEPGDIAILVRTHYEAQELHETLKLLNIPSVIKGKESVFKTTEMWELYILLQALADPSDAGKVLSALALELLGKSNEELLQLQQDDARWAETLLRFETYHLQWEREGFIAMFRKLLVAEGVRARYLELPQGTRALTNLLHLAEIFHKASLTYNLGSSGLLKWIDKKRSTAEINEEYQLRLESDDNAVQIVTIHASKGLEYPVVFCPFCWTEATLNRKLVDKKGIFFHDDEGTLHWDISGNDENHEAVEQAEQETLAENIRLLYVALTRAKHRCYLGWGNIKQTGTAALSYIFNQDECNDELPVVQALRAGVKKQEWQLQRKKIEDMAEAAHAAVDIISVPYTCDTEKSYLAQRAQANYHYRKFSRVLDDRWKISSYSFLVSSSTVHAELPDYDDLEAQNVKGAGEQENSIFSFPAGADAGSCLHEILEKTDFANIAEHSCRERIVRVLEKYNFGREWTDVVYCMLQTLLHKELPVPGTSLLLRNISRHDSCKEMEFYFPLQAIDTGKIIDCFRTHLSLTNYQFVQALEGLDFLPLEGYLKGYIDLVFGWEEKYYIIDWKSNYLGATVSHYNDGALRASMTQHLYYLQYCLYVVALHHYLALRLSDYDYRTHMGGVFYIFLRGIDPAGTTGIFYDLPDRSLIEDLSKILVRQPAEGHMA